MKVLFCSATLERAITRTGWCWLAGVPVSDAINDVAYNVHNDLLSTGATSYELINCALPGLPYYEPID